MISFVEKARTQGMITLNERITQSKDRLAYLIDVFLFSSDDIDLNCEVLTWPKRINPVFDRNEEVSDRYCLYPFMPSGLSHPSKLDQFFSKIMDV
ncbi:hypothetical protein DPMN_121399 [Dreissena polymorpha]|uniref:Uncharacterized protein n=1 Tax=Dreissena polymorpha TaxID=45954 RepID=A0A9D4GMQ7_DREPO|nr:hypothetical protein DPMN_121399 [Dreissena polymorpha]